MGELKKIFLLIQNDINQDNLKEALNTFNIHYNNVKDIKGFQNFAVSIVSVLAQKLQSEFTSTNQSKQFGKNTNDVIQFSDRCFKMINLSELQPIQNSLYVIVKYLLMNNHVSEAVHFSNYFLNNLSPPCDILKYLVQLFAHHIHKTCPIDDDLKKLNVILMWDAALNLVKCHTGKEIEYALSSSLTLVKNINGLILHEGRTMDVVILDMTLESVLSSSGIRKKNDQECMVNLYFMLIENIVAVMQNMMRHRQMHVHYLIKHIKLMIDVCCLNKTEKESLSLLISLFKFIDNSIKNGLDSNFELRKMITFVEKYEPTMILPNTMLHHVFKSAIITITKLKNFWNEGLIINSPETVSQMLVLLHHLVYISKHSSISQICCKSNGCDLKEDSTSEMSLINIVFIMIRHIINANHTFINTEDVLKWMELFTSLFDRVSKSNCSNKIAFIEFSLTSAYNLCIFTSSGEFSHLCLDFLEKLYSVFDPCGIDSELVARVAILLSRCLYNKNKNNEALSCIAYWCVRTRSELAAQQWVYLKCKEERNNNIIKQTILKTFENDIDLKKKWPDYSLKKSDCIEIMWLELKAHNHQNKIKQDSTAVLELFEELMGDKLSREFKCRVIITTAYIILHSNSIRGLKRVIDVLEDYIRKLEVETSMEKKSMPLMLGNLYYANYLCLLKHLQNLVNKELDSYTEERLEHGMEQQNTIQYEPISWILPLKIKPKLVNCLNWAVKYWSALINDTIKDNHDVKLLFKSIQEVAFILKLHGDSKEVKVWQLLYKLASNIKCQKHIFIALTELLKINEIDIFELTNLAKHLPKMDIDYKLALATSLLNKSKFSDAQVLLEGINNNELNNNVILMAEYSYLKSRLCFESGKFDKNKCLSIFIEAYNLAHSLIKRLDYFYEYLAMHFVILSICSYLNLIYINTFKPVEARCFLKVQMNIVLKSALTKRALNVFLMNCWNELMCCNFENANGQLEHVMTLLDFKEEELDFKMQKLTVNYSPNRYSSPLSDYRCSQIPRINTMASPSLKRLNNKLAQLSISEFCDKAINSNGPFDPIVMHSVIEACILKAVYCSKANQQKLAEYYFKHTFKLLELSLPQFNKNEVYNILTVRQKTLAKYHYAEHLVLFNDLSKSMVYLKKAKESCHDEWLSMYVNELIISLKVDNIMSYAISNVNHSPVAESQIMQELRTPKATKPRVNTRSQAVPRFVTPAVRKLRMTLESPNSRQNKIKSPLIKGTEKIKNDSAVKKKIGKENIMKSTTKQDSEIKVREKRGTSKKEHTEQPPSLIIKKRTNRLNI
ncbi:uncharacterized protein LOC100159374 [Acyrthosiphon pisum]|uniref:Separase n=1 Tax=Acyrthosiphon pisum TaxID=7029 RepID=A0A8R2AAY1_ACYPI|nr:uncharacterized protein LOC100159374 [Acyrthosiphon pisum]XP_003243891.1 uncharacterized protein LOC100159374 [Acyrthosiphon pisum]|eukprot:XP_001942739.2 PREDICTED: uncharacterized protein LOC100159374 [Acyrthosiphon pisum]